MSNLPFNHLSASSLNAFGGYGSCELAWRYRYLDKLPSKPKGAPLLAGRAFDQVLQAAYQEKLDGHVPIPADAGQAFLEVWRSEQEKDEYELRDAGNIVDRGIDASIDHVANVAPRVEPVSVQQRIEIAFQEVDWTLTGYIDLVEVAERGVVIVDHKVTASASTKYDEAKAANDLQLGLYDVALTTSGSRVAGRGFRSARLLKTRHELGEAVVASSPEQRETTLDLLGMLAGRIEDACATGTFLPSAYISGSWKCSEKFCDYFASCPFGARARVSVPIANGVAA